MIKRKVRAQRLGYCSCTYEQRRQRRADTSSEGTHSYLLRLTMMCSSKHNTTSSTFYLPGTWTRRHQRKHRTAIQEVAIRFANLQSNQRNMINSKHIDTVYTRNEALFVKVFDCVKCSHLRHPPKHRRAYSRPASFTFFYEYGASVTLI